MGAGSGRGWNTSNAERRGNRVNMADALKESCHGAPDFVVEILSPSNTAIEMGRKFDLYLKAGVREYWVIEPENKGVKAYNLRYLRNRPVSGMLPLYNSSAKTLLFRFWS
jgi:Uma2 family endonuclease